MSAAGTIRACQPSAACGDAVIHPQSIRTFCERIGVAKFNSTIDVTVLENSVRDHLNAVANRVLAVLRPLKVVLTNYPEDQVEMMEAVNNPEDAAAGTRAGAVHVASCSSSRTISWRTHPENFSV